MLSRPAKLVAIAVVGSNRVIGDGKSQPFTIKEDWQRFKKTTMGRPLIMGSRTHRSMGLLPGRTSIVVTRNPQVMEFPVDQDGCPRGYAVASLDDAFAKAAELDPDLAFVVGGGQIYRQAWDVVDELDLTEVDQAPEGSVFLPEVDSAVWDEVSREPRDGFAFVIYRRHAS